MIHPNMATMLSIVLTDAAVAPETLWTLLRPAAVRTWDQLSVDGDTSTNDTVFVLASGDAGAAPADPGSPAAALLGEAIEAVARDLARQQAADGEGATTLITAVVRGAARRHRRPRRGPLGRLVEPGQGRGPRPGPELGPDRRCRRQRPSGQRRGPRGRRAAPPPRRAARAGSPADLDPDRLRIAIAGSAVFDGTAGGPLAFDRAATRAAMDAPELVIELDLGLGDGRGEAFGCDLTEAYVVENSEYTT